MLAVIIIIIISQMGNMVVPTSLDWRRTECIGACKMPWPRAKHIIGAPRMLPGNRGGEKSGFVGVIICLLTTVK